VKNRIELACIAKLHNFDDESADNKIFAVSIPCINPLNAELNPIYHLLALLGAHHIFHVSRVRVNLRLKVILK